MSTRSRRAFRAWILSALVAATLVLVAPPPVRAAAAPAAPLLADEGWSWAWIRSQVESFIHNSFRSRARLVQASAVAVAIGIFIMFRCRRTS